MSWNQDYQDGLGGMKRPSGGNQSAFDAGWHARQQQQFNDMLARNRQPLFSPSPPPAWTYSPPPVYVPARPRTAAEIAADARATAELLDDMGRIAKRVWLVIVCVPMTVVLVPVLLVRAVWWCVSLMRHIKSERLRDFVTRRFEPVDRLLESIQTGIVKGGLWLAGVCKPAAVTEPVADESAAS